MTNFLVLDDVNTDFVGAAYTHINDAGNSMTMVAPTNVSSDSIRDGSTLKFDHRNHGMHSSTNKLKVEGFVSDLPPVLLKTKVDDDTILVGVTTISDFVKFEGVTVDSSNPGYVQIDNEIIEYKGVNTTTGELQTITRGVDSSLKSNHPANAFVYKYEFSGVSLRKINSTHDISDREKTFNEYYVTLSDATKVFNKSKIGGGSNVKISQNVSFEAINPKINCITPTGTDIGARIKTTSGSSVSGNEASFTDMGYENVSLNKINVLDSPRIIASNVNEFELLNNEKSFGLELTLSSSNEDVSPLIDLDTANIIVTSNLVDDNVVDYTADPKPRIPGMDPNSGIYETNRIDLEFPSNSVYVQFDGHREVSAQFRVFYKIYRPDGTDVGQNWIPFNKDGSPDKSVSANTRLDRFSEYKFTAENIPQFTGFMIKVVMTSTNQAEAPRFKNFRAIALRSFAVDD